MNINIKILFRVLLFVPILLFLIYAVLPVVEYLWLSCDELSLLEADGYNSILPKSYIIFCVFVAIWLGISVALFFFIGIARIVYAVFVFISLILMTLVGYRVSAPVENIVLFLMVLSLGVVLTLMYSPSTAEFFMKEDSEDAEKDDEEDEDELP